MFKLSKNSLTYFSETALKRFISSTTCKSKNVQSVYDEYKPYDGGVPQGIMGQPTCHTHPHLVCPGQLVSGLTTKEFTNRRTEFMKRLVTSVTNSMKPNGHTVIIPSAPKLFMTDHIPFIFRQNSDFFYLTGCLEPDSVLIMTCLPNSDAIHKTVLLMRGQDEYSEVWEGPRTSLDDATQLFRIDVALPFNDLRSYLTSHLSDHKRDHLWYSPGSPVHHSVDNTIRQVIDTEKSNPPTCPRRILSTQRLIKSSAEASLLSETCKVASAAINNAMSVTKPGISEHDIHASIDYWCRKAGAEHLAFPPVIGGGERATTIHYIQDNQVLADGELLLVDAGCQKFCYNSDITRTWPVSGKFSPEQAILYDIILSVQQSLLQVLHEQKPTLDKLFDVMCQTLGKYLREERIIPKSTSDSELPALTFKLCPHHVSHYLGLDVHDTPAIFRNIPVTPGMVITVEPGIYIKPNDKTVPKEFRGIGIRIEDDVLITHKDPLILSETCIKNRHDIEKIVGTRSLPE